MRTAAAIAALCAGALAALPRARAAPDDYLSRWASAIQSRLDELAAARAPKVVAPVAQAVTWKAVKIGSIDLGAPLVAMTGADLDGDGKGELYAVTSRDVVAIALKPTKLVELGRVAFGGERAVPAPRDVVGNAVIDRNGATPAVVAAASPWVKELRVTLHGKTLLGQPGAAGFLMCAGGTRPNRVDERWQLVPGRNYFAVAGESYVARCRELVDRDGQPLHVRAVLATTGKLDLEVQICPGGSCEPVVHHEYSAAGVAFEVADVDRDGTPEVIVSGFVPPGDPDFVRVIALGGDDKKSVYKKTFNGGVAGIAIVPVGAALPPAVVAAVRLAGSTRVDLWRLN